MTVVPSLANADMIPILKPAWEKCFSKDKNFKAWAAFGFDPETGGCNRKVYWDKKPKRRLF